MPEPADRALSQAELDAQEAVDLPDREALSLFDTGSLLGAPPIGATDGSAPAAPGGADPSTAPAPPADPTADPTAAAGGTGDPTGLSDKFSGISNKFIG